MHMAEKPRNPQVDEEIKDARLPYRLARVPRLVTHFKHQIPYVQEISGETSESGGLRLSRRRLRHRRSARRPFLRSRRFHGQPSITAIRADYERQIERLEGEIAEGGKKAEKLQSDNQSLRELAMRARAELDNARKRLEREKAEAIKYANERLVGDLVQVVDNLERGLGSVAESEEIKPLRDGIRMVLDQFLGILSGSGLEVVEPNGQTFDPHFHEAVAAEDREDVEDNVVLDTLQKGYVLRGRVVRPAMVRVARAIRKPEPEPELAVTEVADPDGEETVFDAEAGETPEAKVIDPGLAETVEDTVDENATLDESAGQETPSEDTDSIEEVSDEKEEKH